MCDIIKGLIKVLMMLVSIFWTAGSVLYSICMVGEYKNNGRLITFAESDYRGQEAIDDELVFFWLAVSYCVIFVIGALTLEIYRNYREIKLGEKKPSSDDYNIYWMVYLTIHAAVTAVIMVIVLTH